MIVALSGRRIDAANADTPRFPLKNVALVRERIAALLQENVTAFVSSGACGGDLLALDQAGALGIRRRLVLPFSAARFRATSVVDRPGDWGPVYDEVVRAVRA